MKKKKLLALMALFLVVNYTTSATERLIMHKTDNTVKTLEVPGLDSISTYLSAPLTLDVTPTVLEIPVTGGVYVLNVTSNTLWNCIKTVNWIEPTQSEGLGSVSVELNVKKAESQCDESTTTLTFQTQTEQSVTVTINRLGSHGCPDAISYGPILEDCQGNTYSTVWIGTQLWMAENLRCTKYDTESEKAGETIKLYNTSSTNKDIIYDYMRSPYYKDIRYENTEYSGNLSDEEKEKMGYVYNWSAAVGIENTDSQYSPFATTRQGICPNGWHIPTKDEFDKLGNQVDCNLGLTEGGKLLKAVNGWYELPDTKENTDCFGLSILPAGVWQGPDDDHLHYSYAKNIGLVSYFWTATAGGGDQVYFVRFNAVRDYFDYNYSTKKLGRSIRCVRND